MATNSLVFETIARLASVAALSVYFGAPSQEQCSDLATNGKLVECRPSEFIQNSFNCSISAEASWEDFQTLQLIYDISDPLDVYAFLNGQAATLLIEAESIIKRYFQYSGISLAVKTDPEINSRILLVSINSLTDLDDSEKRLDGFCREWWFARKWVPTDRQICVDVIAA